MKAVTGNLHPEFNEQFFGPTGRTGGPVLRTPQSSDSLHSQRHHSGDPNARRVNWKSRGTATPAQPASPK